MQAGLKGAEIRSKEAEHGVAQAEAKSKLLQVEKEIFD